MSKYGPKIYASEMINTKGHFAVGSEWKVVASNGKSDYTVTMHDRGFSCSCPAFRKCKHIVSIEEKFDV